MNEHSQDEPLRNGARALQRLTAQHSKNVRGIVRLPEPVGFDFEVLTSAELAQRLKVKESWVVDQSKRCRTNDPIPVFRLGKHRRFRWGSPELNAWLNRRAGPQHTTTTQGWVSEDGGS
jgi:hypothetical protein